jgi:hypothetical protein
MLLTAIVLALFNANLTACLVMLSIACGWNPIRALSRGEDGAQASDDE